MKLITVHANDENSVEYKPILINIEQIIYIVSGTDGDTTNLKVGENLLGIRETIEELKTLLEIH